MTSKKNDFSLLWLLVPLFFVTLASDENKGKKRFVWILFVVSCMATATIGGYMVGLNHFYVKELDQRILLAADAKPEKAAALLIQVMDFLEEEGLTNEPIYRGVKETWLHPDCGYENALQLNGVLYKANHNGVEVRRVFRPEPYGPKMWWALLVSSWFVIASFCMLFSRGNDE